MDTSNFTQSQDPLTGAQFPSPRDLLPPNLSFGTTPWHLHSSVEHLTFDGRMARVCGSVRRRKEIGRGQSDGLSESNQKQLKPG